MSTPTHHFALPSPGPGTLFKDLGPEFLAFATAIDSTLANFKFLGKDPAATVARIALLETKLAALENPPVTNTTDGMSAAVGWSLTSSQIIRCGKLRQVRVIVSRTGAALNVPVHGNIGNVGIASLRAASDYPADWAHASSGQAGRMAAGWITGSGIFDLVAVAPGGNINTGETFELCATYIAKESA